MKLKFGMISGDRTVVSEANLRRITNERAQVEGIQISWDHLTGTVATVEVPTLKERLAAGASKPTAVAQLRALEQSLRKVFPVSSFDYLIEYYS